MAEWQNSENSVNSGNCGNFSLLCAQNVEDYCMGVWIVWEDECDMAHCHCHICGIPRPVCYYVVAGPIEPESGRWWFGRAANPINEEDREEGKQQ